MAQVRARSWRRLARFLTLAGILMAGNALAAACALPPDLRTDERPTLSGEPTEMTVSAQVLDLMGVDDANQRLEVDLAVQLKWQDPRLAGLAGCRFGITDVWFPAIRLGNSSNLRRSFQNARNQVRVIDDSGTVEYLQRLTGTISSYHNLRDYPFDRQVFEIGFFAVDQLDTALDLIADDENTWISERLNIEGWTVSDVWLERTSKFVRQAGLPIDVVTLHISAERQSDYVVFRFLLLLAFVVGMSWIIFWVPPGRFEFQIGIGATAMLTSIAFNVSITNHLPPLGYMTKLDKMVIWATLLIFLAIVQALLTARLSLNGKDAVAERLDHACRFVFPLVFAVGWFVIVAT